MLTKPIPFQRGHKMHINMFWPNPTHASDNINCFSTWVYQSSPMPARTQNSSQHVLTKPIPCHRGHKMNLNWCWPNVTDVSEGKRKLLQLVLTKTNPWKRGHKTYLNMSWPNTSPASEDTKCFPTSVDQTPHMTERIQSVIQHVLAKPLPSQRGQNMQLNMCWQRWQNVTQLVLKKLQLNMH